MLKDNAANHLKWVNSRRVIDFGASKMTPKSILPNRVGDQANPVFPCRFAHIPRLLVTVSQLIPMLFCRSKW